MGSDSSLNFEDYSEFFVWKFTDLHFSRVSYTSIGFLWWCHACFFHNPWFLMLVFVHLSKWAPLPDFTSSLWQRQFFTSQLSLGFWICVLEMFLGGWNLLTGSVFGWDHCLSSEMAEFSGAIAWEVDGIDGLIPCPSKFDFLPKQGCRRSSMIASVLWSGLLDGQDWVHYSTQQQMGLWISIPALVGQQDETWMAYSLGDLNPVRLLWIPWPDGTWFCSVDRENRWCVFCSSASIGQVVGWAMQLPTCFGWVPW